MNDHNEAAREKMVRTQIVARGLRDRAVLEAMRTVPREAFLPPELEEFAYDDTPLPIESRQTISQPYIVALMTEALELRGSERVLEIGTGSGYAAAILGRVAREVYTVERHEELASLAVRRLRTLGFHNVSVLHGDGTLGWPEHAPFDAIVVAAGGPEGPARAPRATCRGRQAGDSRRRGGFAEVVASHSSGRRPLRRRGSRRRAIRSPHRRGRVGGRASAGRTRARESAGDGRPFAPRGRRAFQDVDTVDVGAVVERIGDARVVLIGEATHGTSEFYRLRARLTRELIHTRGFNIVTAEADWPDAMRVNRYACGTAGADRPWRAFARFPTWMWRNHEVLGFVEWLREWNASRPAEASAGFFGLDLYSMYTSIRLVLDYLDRVDPAAARVARERYGCLTPWEGDAATYGRAAVSGGYRVCENEAVAMLRDMLARQIEYSARDGERWFDATQNARLVADAERYYRVMYYGGVKSWNLRDRHMFETLQSLLAFHGNDSKAVVWAHNSHLGDARAMEMGVRGELNVGQLCREAYGDRAFLIGFGTDHGTVVAASDWDGPTQSMRVRPSHPKSYERLCHDSGVPAFVLHLREPARQEIRYELEAPRLQRAIGVVYRPDTELASHYFQASLPHQFDEYIWLDETSGVQPVADAAARRFPAAHPFSLHEQR